MQSNLFVQSTHNFENNKNRVRKNIFLEYLTKHMKPYCTKNINSEFNETFTR